jgi:hypothetical protein
MRIEIHKQSFEVRQFITGVHVLTVNEHNLFGIEPVTDFGGSQEEKMNECRFNGLTESIPSGPQALSLDFSFPEDSWLYGLPERNDEFAIQNTIGREVSIIKDVSEEETTPNTDLSDPCSGVPYRMFTADHFSD